MAAVFDLSTGDVDLISSLVPVVDVSHAHKGENYAIVVDFLFVELWLCHESDPH